MPINTNYGTLNVGHDISIDVVLPSGRHLILSHITSFDAKPIQKKLKSVGIDGIARNGVIPEGWQLSFDIDRADSNADDFWAAYEDAYYARQTVQNVTITQTISEANGAITVWRYEGVALHFSDAGKWQSDQFVKMKMEGEASFRRKVQ